MVKDGKITYLEREFKSPYPNDVMKLQIEQISMEEYKCINIRVCMKFIEFWI